MSLNTDAEQRLVQVQKCAPGIAYAVRHKKAVPKVSLLKMHLGSMLCRQHVHHQLSTATLC